MQLEAERWTREREVLLAQTIEAGGPEAKRARGEFIEANLPLVRKRVWRMVPSCSRETREDLVGDATEAMIRAVDKFDWRREKRFETFAKVGIDGAVKRWLTKENKKPVPIDIDY